MVPNATQPGAHRLQGRSLAQRAVKSGRTRVYEKRREASSSRRSDRMPPQSLERPGAPVGDRNQVQTSRTAAAASEFARNDVCPGLTTAAQGAQQRPPVTYA